MTTDLKIEFYKDEAGEHRWRARAVNGEIVADSSEGYVNRSDCERMAYNLFPDAVPSDGDSFETSET